MAKRYAVLGGGGSFGIHTSKYLLDNADTDRVIAIGRNPPKPEPFTLNVGQGDKRYSYYAYHVTYELDLLLGLLDKEKPQIIINYAAQGEGAVSWKHSWRFFETNSMALARLTEELAQRDWLERFIQIGTSEMYGSVEHAATEDEPMIEAQWQNMRGQTLESLKPVLLPTDSASMRARRVLQQLIQQQDAA